MENNKVIDTMFNKKDNILIIIWQKGSSWIIKERNISMGGNSAILDGKLFLVIAKRRDD